MILWDSDSLPEREMGGSMLSFVAFVLNAIAAYLLLTGPGGTLGVIALASGIASFWSWGVLNNFRGDPYNAPGWAALVSFVTLVAGIILVLLGLFLN